MMKLEQKQLSNGSYMQRVQIRVGEITPILAHAQELFLLPRAMKWMGEISYELAAYSEIQPDGRVGVRKFLNLRIRVPASAKSELKQVTLDITDHIRGWMSSISVESDVAHYDDESLLVNLAASGYTFIVKDKNRGSNPYYRLLLPLSDSYSVDPQDVAVLLYQYPYSGVTLQLFTDQWAKNEVSALNRFAASARIDSARHDDVMDGGIVCFVCATWGEGASALERLLVGVHGSGLKSSALRLTSEESIRMLPLDPWQMHKRLTGASRYSGILTMSEMKRLFKCMPIHIADERGSFAPAIDVNDMITRLQELIGQGLSQMQHRSEEMMQSAQAWLAQEVRASEARTEERLVDFQDKARQEANQIIRQRECTMLEIMVEGQDALKQQVGQEIQRAVDELYDTVTKEMHEHANQLVGMLGSVQMDVGQLQQTQDKLRTRLEKEALLTERQLDELTKVLDAMSSERDDLKRELLVNTACGVEKPLSESALELLGISSEQTLIDEGMTDKQLSILRIGINGIDGKPVMNKLQPVDGDNIDYQPYVIFFGFLYEQLMRGVYHNKIYAPYYCAVMGANRSPDLRSTQLYCYEKGPETEQGYSFVDWKHDTLAQRLADCVIIDGKTYSQPYWESMFIKMSISRRIRNKIHSLELDRNDAYKMVNALLRGDSYPCLVRMILAANRVRVDFSQYEKKVNENDR